MALRGHGLSNKSELSRPKASYRTEHVEQPAVPACLAPNTWESPAAMIRRETSDRTDLAVRLERKSGRSYDVARIKAPWPSWQRMQR